MVIFPKYLQLPSTNTNFKYLILGHFSKINISWQGTQVQIINTMMNLIYGCLSKIINSYQGTPDTVWSFSDK